MRTVVSICLLSVLCNTAAALNFRATTRADHKSLDVCVRRLENGAKEDIRATLAHLRPMLDRRGGPVVINRIAIGSKDEERLIFAQHGYANTHREHGDIAQDVAISTARWIWQTLKNILNAIIPGLGTLLPFLIVLYLWLRHKDKVIKAMYLDAEKLDKGKRRELFTSSLVVNDYQRRLKRGEVKAFVEEEEARPRTS